MGELVWERGDRYYLMTACKRFMVTRYSQAHDKAAVVAFALPATKDEQPKVIWIERDLPRNDIEAQNAALRRMQEKCEEWNAERSNARPA